MIADSDFENSIMKLTRSMITRKSSRGSGKALVIEMVAAACMVAKYIDFQLSIRQDSEDNMSWLTKKKGFTGHGSRVSHTSLLTSFQGHERKAVAKDSTTHFVIWTSLFIIEWSFQRTNFNFRMPRLFLKSILYVKKH